MKIKKGDKVIAIDQCVMDDTDLTDNPEYALIIDKEYEVLKTFDLGFGKEEGRLPYFDIDSEVVIGSDRLHSFDEYTVCFQGDTLTDSHMFQIVEEEDDGQT